MSMKTILYKLRCIYALLICLMWASVPAFPQMNLSLEDIIFCNNIMLTCTLELSETLPETDTLWLELSQADGSFPGIYQKEYIVGSELISVILYPLKNALAPPSDKYRLRGIFEGEEVFVTPDFTIYICDNFVETLEPQVFQDPDNPSLITNGLPEICKGSYLEIPFHSWDNNIDAYIVELSNEKGQFQGQGVTILYKEFIDLGTFPNQAGSIKVHIADNPNKTIKPGCNYYLRIADNVFSGKSNPYGPFCIRDCSIRIDVHNEQDDLDKYFFEDEPSVCLSDTDSTLLNITMKKLNVDSIPENNQFKIEFWSRSVAEEFFLYEEETFYFKTDSVWKNDSMLIYYTYFPTINELINDYKLQTGRILYSHQSNKLAG